MNAQNLAIKLREHYRSDAEVAELVGVSQTTISRIRRGVIDPRASIYQAMLAQLAEVEHRPQ